jgi:hypothetical protein
LPLQAFNKAPFISFKRIQYNSRCFFRQQKLKASGDNSLNRQILIQLFPAQRETVHLNRHFFQFLFRRRFQNPESTRGEADNASIGKLKKIIRPSAQARRAQELFSIAVAVIVFAQ